MCDERVAAGRFRPLLVTVFTSRGCETGADGALDALLALGIRVALQLSRTISLDWDAFFAFAPDNEVASDIAETLFGSRRCLAIINFDSSDLDFWRDLRVFVCFLGIGSL